MTTAVLLSQACIAALPIRIVARFNNISLLLNVVLVVAFIIAVPLSATRNGFAASETVWQSIDGGVDWPDGVALLMSFMPAVWTMAGFDAAFHLSEECRNGAVAAPKVIVMTAGLGGALGWAVNILIACGSPYERASTPALTRSDRHDLGRSGQSFRRRWAAVHRLPSWVPVALLCNALG